MIYAPKKTGDVTDLKRPPIGTSGAGSTPQATACIENQFVSIQACRADLQDFLQRTRNRLQAITDNVNACFENISDEHDASRFLPDAERTQVLKPLPNLNPMQQRRNEQINVSASTVGLRSQDMVDQARSTNPRGDLSSPSPSATERFAMEARMQVVADSGDNVAVPRAGLNEADWRVSNAFDRNTYYGPTDFAQMPDDSEGLASRGFCSNEETAFSDAFCSGTLLIEFGRAHALPGRMSRSSRLHLANQIRKN